MSNSRSAFLSAVPESADSEDEKTDQNCPPIIPSRSRGRSADSCGWGTMRSIRSRSPSTTSSSEEGRSLWLSMRGTSRRRALARASSWGSGSGQRCCATPPAGSTNETVRINNGMRLNRGSSLVLQQTQPATCESDESNDVSQSDDCHRQPPGRPRRWFLKSLCEQTRTSGISHGAPLTVNALSTCSTFAPLLARGYTRNMPSPY